MFKSKFNCIICMILVVFSCNVNGCASKKELKPQAQALVGGIPHWKPIVGPTENGLRIIKVQMGNENGDGMDGGLFGNKNWGGGRFSFEFFFQNQSCETGVLKTDDDNWEKGQINYFVGHQIGSCENFPLDSIGKNTNRITY